MHEEPVILTSARRHKIADPDILHAWRNTIDVWERDERMSMLVGPDRSGRLLEIGIVEGGDGLMMIVHAMTARKKFLRR